MRERLQIGLSAAYGAHHGRSGQVFLAGKMFVQTGLGDPDLGGNFVDRHRVKTLIGQQSVDHPDDGLLTRLQHLGFERDFGDRARLHLRSLAVIVKP